MTTRSRDEFTQAVQNAKEKCAALLASPRCSMYRLPADMPLKGVYLFSEKGRALYAGRSDKLRKRLRLHVRNSHNTATLAFLIARDKTGLRKATYQKAGSRSELLKKNRRFLSEFELARERIRCMDIQFIEEAEPTRQVIIEICVALLAGTKYNRFDNH
ncbi:MAG: GIY-YIG nuclease family protein [candidate division WOR-3 bacterium]|nr:GIY-YIG nuclease family protein [candidate division WOR-3 bacterium]